MTNSSPGASQEARSVAAALLQAGAIGSDWERSSAELLEPAPVLSVNGRHVAWFVGVATGDVLVGFVILTPGLELHRYSTFMSQPGALDRCPEVQDWLDPTLIRRRAGRIVTTGETLEEPFLSFVRSPDQIAWAVPAVDESGRRRLIWVAGKAVFTVPDEGEPSTG